MRPTSRQVFLNSWVQRKTIYKLPIKKTPLFSVTECVLSTTLRVREIIGVNPLIQLFLTVQIYMSILCIIISLIYALLLLGDSISSLG